MAIRNQTVMSSWKQCKDTLFQTLITFSTKLEEQLRLCIKLQRFIGIKKNLEFKVTVH